MGNLKLDIRLEVILSYYDIMAADTGSGLGYLIEKTCSHTQPGIVLPSTET
jgi:hypothetical protein